MSVMAPEAVDLEQLWDETPPVCELGCNCDKEARWLAVFTCPCSVKRIKSCDDDRRWLVQVLKDWTSRAECCLCNQEMTGVRWLPL